VLRVHARAINLEQAFGAPQDVEWTFKGPRFYVLQSRDITTTKTGKGDSRAWYLSLRRSVKNLQDLRKRIEGDLIPKMDAEARDWAKLNVRALSNEALLAEFARRLDRYEAWLSRYWDECIPFAHGVRLFGQVYNDAVHPTDPYEFIELLSGRGLLSVKRNNALERLAGQVRGDRQLRAALERGDLQTGPEAFWHAVDRFADEVGTGQVGPAGTHEARKPVVALLMQMAQRPRPDAPSGRRGTGDLERAFLAGFSGRKRSEAKELLELGRASYRLRDDDNIYLGRIAYQMERTRDEAKRRKLKVSSKLPDGLTMRPTGGQAHSARPAGQASPGFAMRARQLPGQPAGPGLGAGAARVIRSPQELFEFRSGEVLVCDAVDPNMTFAMPLAGGIVECRGGMLVHGAIIAREYGIPCVNGVSSALSMISTGDRLQVDGYLGIVTIG
jgi:pyruvate,water dikinase